jgi:hypothetical protein
MNRTDTIAWLTKASAADTCYYARREDDIDILKEALAIVAGKEKTKAKYIQARIKQLGRKSV